MPNNQETLDFVAEKLFEQGQPSVGEDGKCKYRGPNNCKCAAGHVLPDDKYQPYFEGKSASIYSELFHIFKDLGYDTHLLGKLQWAHDNAAGSDIGFINQLDKNFQVVAKDFHLTYTRPDLKGAKLP